VRGTSVLIGNDRASDPTRGRQHWVHFCGHVDPRIRNPQVVDVKLLRGKQKQRRKDAVSVHS